jgi:hypothetical protein
MLADAASSTLQEFGKSVMDASVSQDKAVIDPDGSLQPTTVDGRPRCAFPTLPPARKLVLARTASCAVSVTATSSTRLTSLATR